MFKSLNLMYELAGLFRKGCTSNLMGLFESTDDEGQLQNTLTHLLTGK